MLASLGGWVFVGSLGRFREVGGGCERGWGEVRRSLRRLWNLPLSASDRASGSRQLAAGGWKWRFWRLLAPKKAAGSDEFS